MTDELAANHDTQGSQGTSGATTEERIITGVIDTATNRNKVNFLGRIHLKSDEGEIIKLENVAAFGSVGDYIKPGTRGTFYIKGGQNNSDFEDGSVIIGIEMDDGARVCDEQTRAKHVQLAKTGVAFASIKGLFIGAVGTPLTMGLMNAIFSSSQVWSMGVYLTGAVGGAIYCVWFNARHQRQVLSTFDPEGINRFVERHGFTSGTK